MRQDEMTGLLNKRGLEEAYDQFIEALDGSVDHGLMFILIDADNFKRINTEHGYPVGDDVICEMGQRLKQFMHTSARSGDAMGRFGGDEFIFMAMVPADVDHQSFANHMIGRMRAEVEGTVMVGERADHLKAIELRISGSGFFLRYDQRAMTFREVVNGTQAGLHDDKAERKAAMQSTTR